MRKRRLLATLLLTASGLAACAPKPASSGRNPHYDEMNRLSYDEFEFHLGDTLPSLKEQYQQLEISEEELLPAKDSEDSSYVLGNGQNVLAYMGTYPITKSTDGQSPITLLWATVENRSAAEMGSYQLPISGYEAEDSAAARLSLPPSILGMIKEHRGDPRHPLG